MVRPDVAVVQLVTSGLFLKGKDFGSMTGQQIDLLSGFSLPQCLQQRIPRAPLHRCTTCVGALSLPLLL